MLEHISTNKPSWHISSSSKNTAYPKPINDSFKILNVKPGTRGLYFDYFFLNLSIKKPSGKNNISGEKSKTGPAAKIVPSKIWLGQFSPTFGSIILWLDDSKMAAGGPAKQAFPQQKVAL